MEKLFASLSFSLHKNSKKCKRKDPPQTQSLDENNDSFSIPAKSIIAELRIVEFHSDQWKNDILWTGSVFEHVNKFYWFFISIIPEGNSIRAMCIQKFGYKRRTVLYWGNIQSVLNLTASSILHFSSKTLSTWTDYSSAPMPHFV